MKIIINSNESILSRILRRILDFFYNSGVNRQTYHKIRGEFSFKETEKVSMDFDYSDIYNLDTTLAKIIYPLLIKIKHESTSFAQVDPNDVPSNFKDSEAWDYVLDEMIYSFHSYFSERYNQDENRIQNGLRLFGKYYTSLWD